VKTGRPELSNEKKIISRKVGFLGAGRMATALARGFIQAGIVDVDSVLASDVMEESCQGFTTATGAATVSSNGQLVENSEIIFLAVKPQSMNSVLAEIQKEIDDKHLVISIAAGITISTLEKELGSDKRIIRVMPNTPCLVGEGASVISRGKSPTDDDMQIAKRLMTTLGYCAELPERHLDAVTGLSGSGPAYAFQMIEALSDGGVCMGLPRRIATELAAQTLLGAARMVLETGCHPAELKDQVTSPAGTTIAGLHVLEMGAFRGNLMAAVIAATNRSRELSQLE